MTDDRIPCLGACGKSEPQSRHAGGLLRWLCAECGAKGVSIAGEKDAEIARLRKALADEVEAHRAKRAHFDEVAQKLCENTVELCRVVGERDALLATPAVTLHQVADFRANAHAIRHGKCPADPHDHECNLVTAVQGNAYADGARYWKARAESAESAGETITNDLAAAREQKDGAYRERDQCVAGFATLAKALGWPVWLAAHVGDPWEDDWRNIVYVQTPYGQMSWHYHDSEREWFSSVAFDSPPQAWDGHSTEAKYERMRGLVHDGVTLKGGS